MAKRRSRTQARLIQTNASGWLPGSYRCSEYGLPSLVGRRVPEYIDQWSATIEELGGHDAYRAD